MALTHQYDEGQKNGGGVGRWARFIPKRSARPGFSLSNTGLTVWFFDMFLLSLATGTIINP
jgi:hypothetical protein